LKKEDALVAQLDRATAF